MVAPSRGRALCAASAFFFLYTYSMPMLLYAGIVAFGAGVALRTLVSVPLSLLGLLLVIATAVALIAWRYGGSTPLLLVCVVVCSLVAGIARTELSWRAVGDSSLASMVGSEVVLEGVVAREPQLRERSLHLYLRTADGDLLLVTTDRYEAVAYGDRLRTTGALTVPESFETELGRTFNYPGYLLARGVEYRLSYPELQVLEQGQGNIFLARLYGAKQRFVMALGAVLPEPAFGLGVGLLLGVKQALGEELERVFRVTGLTHIVVLSGYNLSLVVAFVSFVLSFFLRPRARLIVGLFAILGFALMVGLSATVLRASLMAALALIASTFGRQYLVMRALLLSAAAMLMWNPFLLLYDIGFQFSFMATLGLILVAPQLETAFTQGKFIYKLRELLIATVAAQVAVLPLLLYHIGEISLVSVVVNVLVLPMVPVAMGLTFATGVLALLSPPLATLLAYPTTLVLSYVTGMASAWASLSFAALPVPTFSFAWVTVAYALLWYGCYRAGYFAPVTAHVVSPMGRERDASEVTATADWTIEEELFVKEQLAKKVAAGPSLEDPAATLSQQNKNDLPSFFR